MPLIPLRRNKERIVSSRMNPGGREPKSKYFVIYDLWKNDRKSFEKYVKGDVHDTLLVAEDLFRGRTM